jgi:hypothetical protein
MLMSRLINYISASIATVANNRKEMAKQKYYDLGMACAHTTSKDRCIFLMTWAMYVLQDDSLIPYLVAACVDPKLSTCIQTGQVGTGGSGLFDDLPGSNGDLPSTIGQSNTVNTVINQSNTIINISNVGGGSLEFVEAFEVGAVGAPMDAGEDEYTNPAIVGYKTWVLSNGSKLIDQPHLLYRYVTKVLGENKITFNGGVIGGEYIEIYRYK